MLGYINYKTLTANLNTGTSGVQVSPLTSDTLSPGIWQLSYSTRILGSNTGTTVTSIQSSVQVTSTSVPSGFPYTIGAQGLTCAMTTAAGYGPGNLFVSGSGTVNLIASSTAIIVIYLYWSGNQLFLAGASTNSETYLMCTRIG